MQNIKKKINLILKVLNFSKISIAKTSMILVLMSSVLVLKYFYKLIIKEFILFIKHFIKSFLFLYLFRFAFFFIFSFFFKMKTVIIVFFFFLIFMYIYLIYTIIKITNCRYCLSLNRKRFWKNLRIKRI